MELQKIADLPVVKTIFKLPMRPSGMMYVAALTLPFSNCSFVLKVQAAESGTTGIRDALIANRMMIDGTLSITSNGSAEGWFEDPYDKNIKEGLLMNQSEQEIYDDEFPGHPLTKARKIIAQIKNEIVLKPEIQNLKPFVK